MQRLWSAPRVCPAFTRAWRHVGTPLVTAPAPARAPGVPPVAAIARPPQGHGRLSPFSSWDGAGLSQEELMIKDECILVDEQDRITGHANKYSSHRFNAEQPRGLLHRAFSVFLFNSENKLLLQQRAACKITFPRVWTNTCCSHQLHGYEPTEVDSEADIAAGQVPGAKRAAVRKLLHELGIPPEQLPLERFKYLTRLHYCAADTGTWGPGTEWGEHEMDYILFIKADVSLEPNPEEVMDTRYVSLPELRAMMRPESGLRWSPWFRIIAEHFLERWWADLDATLGSDLHVDTATVHKLDAEAAQQQAAAQPAGGEQQQPAGQRAEGQQQ